MYENRTKEEMEMEFEEFVNEKMQVLFDMCIIRKNSKNATALKELFLSYGNEIAVDNTCHDIMFNGKPISDVLKSQKSVFNI